MILVSCLTQNIGVPCVCHQPDDVLDVPQRAASQDEVVEVYGVVTAALIDHLTVEAVQVGVRRLVLQDESVPVLEYIALGRILFQQVAAHILHFQISLPIQRFRLDVTNAFISQLWNYP